MMTMKRMGNLGQAEVTIYTDFLETGWIGIVNWPAKEKCDKQFDFITKGYKSRSSCRRAVNKFLERNGLEEVDE